VFLIEYSKILKAGGNMKKNVIWYFAIGLSLITIVAILSILIFYMGERWFLSKKAS